MNRYSCTCTMFSAQTASTVVMLSLLVAFCVAEISAAADTDAYDCIRYCQDNNSGDKIKKKFRSQMTFSINVTQNQKLWEVDLVLHSKATGHNCTLEMAVRKVNSSVGTETELNVNCTKWRDGESEYEPLKAEKMIKKMQGIPNIELLIVEEELQVSAVSGDMTKIGFNNSGLIGELEAELKSDQLRICVTFNCLAGCTLRKYKVSRSNFNDLFYFWRGRQEDRLQFLQRKTESVLAVDDQLDGLQNWFAVLVDEQKETIKWKALVCLQEQPNINCSSRWSSLTAVKSIISVQVPGSSLITNCHPDRLTCSEELYHCRSLRRPRSEDFLKQVAPGYWRLTSEGVVLSTLLIVIAVLVVVACYYKRKSRHTGQQDNNNIGTCGGGGYAHWERHGSTASKKEIVNEFNTESPFYDDFSSVHIYDDF